MVTDAVACVLDELGVRSARVAVLKDNPSGNGNWLARMPGGQRAVLRRYHPGASPGDVPHPVSELMCHDELWYCLTHHQAE